jgi:hypothetical protein
MNRESSSIVYYMYVRRSKTLPYPSISPSGTPSTRPTHTKSTRKTNKTAKPQNQYYRISPPPNRIPSTQHLISDVTSPWSKGRTQTARYQTPFALPVIPFARLGTDPDQVPIRRGDRPNGYGLGGGLVTCRGDSGWQPVVRVPVPVYGQICATEGGLPRPCGIDESGWGCGMVIRR